MKPLDELINTDEPALALIHQWLSSAKNECTLLPPSADRGDVLLRTQVTTRSPLGTIVYETGGVLIDNGWLRFLGSGHPSLTRKLPDWNEGKADQCYFVADDAAGGFFAINGGAFGSDTRNVYYWPPDSFEWEPMNLTFTGFFHWALIADLEKFYTGIRWSSWRQDVSSLSGDRCFDFYPPLWTREGSPDGSRRASVPIEEAFAARIDFLRQLGTTTSE